MQGYTGEFKYKILRSVWIQGTGTRPSLVQLLDLLIAQPHTE
jgi:hypothetical protein